MERRLLDLWSPKLGPCHPSTLIYSRLTREALCEPRVVQFTICLTLHPNTFLLAGSKICARAKLNVALPSGVQQ